MYEDCVIVLRELNYCCICLDDILQSSSAVLRCCENSIHYDCLFEILMKKK